MTDTKTTSRPAFIPSRPGLAPYSLTQPVPTRSAYLTHPGSYSGPRPDLLPTDIVTRR